MSRRSRNASRRLQQSSPATGAHYLQDTRAASRQSSVPALPPGARPRAIPQQPPSSALQVIPGPYTPAASGLQGTNSQPIDYFRPGPPRPGVAATLPGARPGPLGFAPGDPIRPAPGLDDGFGGPRQWAYPTGVNITTVPRSVEVWGFQTLRSLARLFHGVQLCVEVILRILDRLEITVVPRQDYLRADEDEHAEKWLGPGRQMRDWFLSPSSGEDLHAWMRMVMRELCEIDGCGIYHERTRGGYLAGLRVITGDTLVRYVDTVGKTPVVPYPAYEQIINGAPAGIYSADELDYLRVNARADSMYGLPPTEQIILDINQALRKQHYDLTLFTDGSTPEGFIATSEAQNLGMTADQVSEYERLLNAQLAGNDQLRVRIKALPPGWQWIATKASVPTTEFDSYLMGICVAAFGLTKEELGITDTSNRSTGASQEDVIYRNAVRPRSDFMARYLSGIIRRYDGLPIADRAATVSRAAAPTKAAKGTWDARYYVRFDGVLEPSDWNQRAFALNGLVKSGVIGPTQAKHLLQIPILSGEQHVPPYVLAPSGMQSVVFLDDMLAKRDTINAAHEAELGAKTQTAQQQVAIGQNNQSMSDQQVQMGQVNLDTAKLQRDHLKQQMQQERESAKQQQQQNGQQPPPNGPAGGPGGGGGGGGGTPRQPSAPKAPSTTSTTSTTAAQGRQPASGSAGALGATPPAQGAQNRAVDAHGPSLDLDPETIEPDTPDTPDTSEEDTDDADDLRPVARRDACGGPGVEPGPDGRRDAGGRGYDAVGRAAALADPTAGARSGDGARSGADGRSLSASGGERGGASSAATSGQRTARGTSLGTIGTGSASRAGSGGSAGSASGGERGAGSGTPESAGDQRAGTGASGANSRGDASAGSGARDEYRLWREKALKAVKRGAARTPFVAYAIPREEVAWIGGALVGATTPDAVRAVFEEARTRFALVAEQRVADADDADEKAEEHTGIMVAFMLPAAIAQSLHDAFVQAIQNHPQRDDIKPLPVAEMHVTLAYLGDTTADGWSTRKARTLGRVVDDFAEDQMPFPIHLGGVARFHNEGRAGHELDAVYVPVESEAIQGFRRALVDTLNARDLSVDTTFPDYQPHVTLAYIPPDMATPAVTVPSGEASVDALTVAIGGEHTAYPLGTEQHGNALEVVEATPARTAQADSLVDLAVALQRLGILSAADQQAQVIEQVRDLRAQVAQALRAS